MTQPVAQPPEPEGQPTVQNEPVRARRRGGFLAALGDLFGRTKVGDLTAVVVGLLAVLLIAVVAIAVVHTDSASVVAVATGAFGVIGSVVGAYFGVKVGSEQRDRDAAAAQAFALHVPRDDVDPAIQTLLELRRATPD